MTARVACLVVLVAAVAAPGPPQAHALLDRTEPERGAALDSAPGEVAFYFNEPVEASFGAVRVFDAEGDAGRDRGDHPARRRQRCDRRPDRGRPRATATYTATYRVVSADSHPVSGGFVFTVGRAGGGSARVCLGAARRDRGRRPSPRSPSGQRAGSATSRSASGSAASASSSVFGPAMRRSGGGEEWGEAADGAWNADARRCCSSPPSAGSWPARCARAPGGDRGRDLVLVRARAGGIGDVLDTRFGLLTGLRVVAWALLARRRRDGFRPVARGRPIALAALAVAAAFLVATPALAGHASTQEPTWVLLPADVVHVTAMSLGSAGSARSCSRFPPPPRCSSDRSAAALLAAACCVFSPLALACVDRAGRGGTIQAIVYVGPLSDLVDTAFGRAVLIKIGLLLGLIGLGALNRRRSLPALRESAERREPPGRPGRSFAAPARRGRADRRRARGDGGARQLPAAERGERGAGLGLGRRSAGRRSITRSTRPAGAKRDAPLPLRLRGRRAVHRRQGAQVDLELPAKDIGPIEVELRPAGPGHYVAPRAPFGVWGDWLVDVAMRMSRFEQDETEFEVPIG